MVYAGAGDRSKPYFSALGYKFPEEENPADVMMDITYGTHAHPSRRALDLPACWEEFEQQRAAKRERVKGSSSTSRHKRSSGSFHDSGSTGPGSTGPRPRTESANGSSSSQFGRTDVETGKSAPSSNGTVGRDRGASDDLRSGASTDVDQAAVDIDDPSFRVRLSDVVPETDGSPGSGKYTIHTAIRLQSNGGRDTPGFSRQLAWYTGRIFTQVTRRPGVIFKNCLMVYVAGMLLGNLYSNVDTGSALGAGGLPCNCSQGMCTAEGVPVAKACLDSLGAVVMQYQQAFTLSLLAVGLTSISTGLDVFGNERVYYWRESRYKFSTMAYILGKNVVQLPLTFIYTFSFLGSFYPLLNPRGMYSVFFIIFALVSWVAEVRCVASNRFVPCL